LKRAQAACFDCKLIYTLGTSTRSSEEFISLLRRHGVDTVVDVRKFAKSRFEWFCEERLSDLLSEAGIDYINMGRQLGGYRKGGYESFTTTAGFQEAVRDLEKVARRKTVSLFVLSDYPGAAIAVSSVSSWRGGGGRWSISSKKRGIGSRERLCRQSERCWECRAIF
jgi:hypothetical protein